MNASRRLVLLLSVVFVASPFCTGQLQAQESDDAAVSRLRAEKIVSTLTKLIINDKDEQLRMEAIDALVSFYQASSIEKVQDLIVDALLELVEDVAHERTIRAKAIQGILVIMEELDGNRVVPVQ